jgi:Predicted membrane protein
MSTSQAVPLRVLHRLLNLHLGLVLFGISVALMVRADLGLDSWDVLHQGLARRTGLPFGWVVNGVGGLVLLLWLPLRQRLGVGTVSNVIVVGLVADATLGVLPQPHDLMIQVTLLVAAIMLNGVATGLYVGAGLGPGPRDGLMTGLAARGHSLRAVRTSIELTVLLVGWLLGGTVGVGTLAFAVAIGPLVHYLIPKLSITPTVRHEGVPPSCPA